MPETNTKPVALVKKQGTVCQVFLDSSGKPMPFSNFDDEAPAGTFPQTYNSVLECQSHLAGYTLQFIERPTNPKKATVGQVDYAKIQAVIRATGPDGRDRAPMGVAAKSEPTRAIDSHINKANAYVDKLLCARKYASDENKELLDLKVETAEELIAEVFGV